MTMMKVTVVSVGLWLSVVGGAPARVAPRGLSVPRITTPSSNTPYDPHQRPSRSSPDGGEGRSLCGASEGCQEEDATTGTMAGQEGPRATQVSSSIVNKKVDDTAPSAVHSVLQKATRVSGDDGEKQPRGAATDHLGLFTWSWVEHSTQTGGPAQDGYQSSQTQARPSPHPSANPWTGPSNSSGSMKQTESDDPQAGYTGTQDDVVPEVRSSYDGHVSHVPRASEGDGHVGHVPRAGVAKKDSHTVHSPATPAARDPVTKGPAARDPVTRGPAARDPVTRGPAARDPVTRRPAARDPVTRGPAARDPVTRGPAARDPVTRGPAAPAYHHPDPLYTEEVTQTTADHTHDAAPGTPSSWLERENPAPGTLTQVHPAPPIYVTRVPAISVRANTGAPPPAADVTPDPPPAPSGAGQRAQVASDPGQHTWIEHPSGIMFFFPPEEHGTFLDVESGKPPVASAPDGVMEQSRYKTSVWDDRLERSTDETMHKFKGFEHLLTSEYVETTPKSHAFTPIPERLDPTSEQFAVILKQLVEQYKTPSDDPKQHQIRNEQSTTNIPEQSTSILMQTATRNRQQMPEQLEQSLKRPNQSVVTHEQQTLTYEQSQKWLKQQILSADHSTTKPTINNEQFTNRSQQLPKSNERPTMGRPEEPPRKPEQVVPDRPSWSLQRPHKTIEQSILRAELPHVFPKQTTVTPEQISKPHKQLTREPEQSRIWNEQTTVRALRPFAWSEQAYKRHLQAFRWSEQPVMKSEQSTMKPRESKFSPQPESSEQETELNTSLLQEPTIGNEQWNDILHEIPPVPEQPNKRPEQVNPTETVPGLRPEQLEVHLEQQNSYPEESSQEYDKTSEPLHPEHETPESLVEGQKDGRASGSVFNVKQVMKQHPHTLQTPSISSSTPAQSNESMAATTGSPTVVYGQGARSDPPQAAGLERSGVQATLSTSTGHGLQEFDDSMIMFKNSPQRGFNQSQDDVEGSPSAYEHRHYWPMTGFSSDGNSAAEYQEDAPKYPRREHTTLSSPGPTPSIILEAVTRSSPHTSPEAPRSLYGNDSASLPLFNHTASIGPYGTSTQKPDCEDDSVLSSLLGFYSTVFSGTVNPCRESTPAALPLNTPATQEVTPTQGLNSTAASLALVTPPPSLFVNNVKFLTLNRTSSAATPTFTTQSTHQDATPSEGAHLVQTLVTTSAAVSASYTSTPWETRAAGHMAPHIIVNTTTGSVDRVPTKNNDDPSHPAAVVDITLVVTDMAADDNDRLTKESPAPESTTVVGPSAHIADVNGSESRPTAALVAANGSSLVVSSTMLESQEESQTTHLPTELAMWVRVPTISPPGSMSSLSRMWSESSEANGASTRLPISEPTVHMGTSSLWNDWYRRWKFLGQPQSTTRGSVTKTLNLLPTEETITSVSVSTPPPPVMTDLVMELEALSQGRSSHDASPTTTKISTTPTLTTVESSFPDPEIRPTTRTTQLTIPSAKATTPKSQTTTPTIQIITPPTHSLIPTSRHVVSAGLGEVLGSLWTLVGFTRPTPTFPASHVVTTTSPTTVTTTNIIAPTTVTTKAITPTTRASIESMIIISPTATVAATAPTTSITAKSDTQTTVAATVTTTIAISHLTFPHSRREDTTSTHMTPDSKGRESYVHEEPSSSIPLYTIHNLTTTTPPSASVITSYPQSLNYRSHMSTPDIRRYGHGDNVAGSSGSTSHAVESENVTEDPTELSFTPRAPSSTKSLANLYRLISNLRGSGQGQLSQGQQDDDGGDKEGARNGNISPFVPQSLASSFAGMFPVEPTIFSKDSGEEDTSYKIANDRYDNRGHVMTHDTGVSRIVTTPPPYLTKTFPTDRYPGASPQHPFYKYSSDRHTDRPLVHRRPLSHHLPTLNHRPSSSNRQRPSLQRPTIIIKKGGTRLHIPVIPSADFSSFRPQGRLQTSSQQKPREASEPSRGKDKSTNTISRPGLASLSYETPPETDETERQIKMEPQVDMLVPSRLLPRPPPRPPRPPPSEVKMQRHEGCGSTLLGHMEDLAGRELLMDQFGMRVYTSVIESILTVECGDQEWAVEGGLMTDPWTLAHTPTTPPLAQLSPPLPAPTTGMDGWLTLDDLQAQEEKEQEVLRRQHEVEGQPRSIPSHALALTTNQGFYSTVRLTPQPPSSTLPSSTTTTITRALASSVAVHLSAPPSLPLDYYQRSLASTSTSPSSASSTPSSSSLTLLKPQTSPFPPSSDSVSSLPSPVSSSSSSLLTSPSPTFPGSGLSAPSTPQSTASPPPSNTPTSSLLPYWSPTTVSSPYSPSGERQVRARRVAGRPGGSSSPGVVAAGLLALHQLALATAGARPEDPASPPATLAMESPKALSSTVFGFETILTGLVYLSFGIFLYQMIQRAVDARTAGSLTLTSSGRSVWDDAPGPQLPSLLHSLEEAPNVAAEMVLVGVQGSEVWARRPPCLPLYLCRINLLHHHQPRNTTSAIRRSALAALSSAMSVWAGLNKSDLLLPSSLASWNGAQGLPCHHAQAACRIHLSKSASHPHDYHHTHHQPQTYRKRQIGTNLLKRPPLAAPLT